MNDITLDQLDNDVIMLARYYVIKPLVELTVDIRDLRQHVFTLIESNRHPGQLRHLYLIASRICGLQTHATLDMGNYAAADSHARTAWLCADLADHHDARAWVRSVQSLIAYWDGRFAEAANLAQGGLRYPTTDSSTIRLPSLEARARAALGDQQGVLNALRAADDARGRLTDSTDEPGGVFTFPEAKQATYAGTARLAVRDPQQLQLAVADSQRAIDLYESGPPHDRSSGDVMAAYLDIATAYLLSGDLDGVREHLDKVLCAPPERRIASIVTRARTLRSSLALPQLQSSQLSTLMRDQITEFCKPPPALPQPGQKAAP